jgi:hypothetical protein
LSTLQMAASCTLVFAARLSAGQSVVLTLSPVETHTDKTVQLKLFLNAPSSSPPAALQWIFKLPPGLDIERIEAGEAVKTAGKTLVCNGAKCIVYGLNRTTIPNGPVAIVKVKVDQKFARAERSKENYEANGRARARRKPKIQIDDLVAASLDGKAIPVAPGTSSWPIR